MDLEFVETHAIMNDDFTDINSQDVEFVDAIQSNEINDSVENSIDPKIKQTHEIPS